MGAKKTKKATGKKARGKVKAGTDAMISPRG